MNYDADVGAESDCVLCVSCSPSIIPIPISRYLA